MQILNANERLYMLSIHKVLLLHRSQNLLKVSVLNKKVMDVVLPVNTITKYCIQSPHHMRGMHRLEKMSSHVDA